MRKKRWVAVVTALFIIAGVFFFFRQPVEIDPPPEPEGNISLQTAEDTPRARVDTVSTDPLNVTAGERPFYTDPQDDITEPEKSGPPAVSTEEHQVKNDEPQFSYRVIHHEAEYKIIHHDVVTIHHDAEYKIIHHEAEGHYEEVVVNPAWDETVAKEVWVEHTICNEDKCRMDFTLAGYSEDQIWDHLEAHALKGEASGHHTEDIKTVVTETIHHDAITERVWITDKDAWDEKVLVKEAWDEVTPAYDEKVLVKEAWDEKVPG